MKWYLCVLVTTLAPFVHSQLKEIPYPTFAQCDEKIISTIHDYWKTAGKPKNVLQTMNNDGLYILVHHSYKFRNGTIKCVDIEYNNGAFTLYLIHSNGTPLNIAYIVETDEDEVIRGRLPGSDAPKFRWNWYTIYHDKGIAVTYICGDVTGIDRAPLADIFLRKRDVNMINSSEVNNFNNMLGEWGFDMGTTYGKECF